jgi:hypothetical protein
MVYDIDSNQQDATSWVNRFRINGNTGDVLLGINGGNVGIGTGSPTGKLDVRTGAGVAAQMNLYSGNNATVTKFSIGQIGSIDWDIGISATNGHFYIGGLGGSMPEAYRITRSGASVDNQTWNTGGAERMRITSAGDVGIGTSSPATKLSVLGATGRFSEMTGNTIRNRLAASEGGWTSEMGFANNAGTLLTGMVAGGSSQAATYLAFQRPGNVEAMRIDASGKLLVGFTASKTYGNLLQVKNSFEAIGTDATTPVTVAAYDHNALDASPTYSSAILRKFGASAAGNLYFASNIAAAGWAEIGGINVQGGVVFGTNSGVPIVFGSAGVERMRMDTSGNLSSAGDQYRTRYYQTGSFIPNSTNWMRLCTLPATNQGQYVEFIFTIPGVHIQLKVKFSKTTAGGQGGGGILEVEQIGSYAYWNYCPFDWRLRDLGTNSDSHIDIRFPHNAGESIGYRINVLHSYCAGGVSTQPTFPLTNLGSGTTGSYYVNMGSNITGWTKQLFKLTGSKFRYHDFDMNHFGGQTAPTA